MNVAAVGSTVIRRRRLNSWMQKAGGELSLTDVAYPGSSFGLFEALDQPQQPLTASNNTLSHAFPTPFASETSLGLRPFFNCRLLFNCFQHHPSKLIIVGYWPPFPLDLLAESLVTPFFPCCRSLSLFCKFYPTIASRCRFAYQCTHSDSYLSSATEPS